MYGVNKLNVVTQVVEISAQFAPIDQWATFVAQGKRTSLMPVGDQHFYFFFDVPLS